MAPKSRTPAVGVAPPVYVNGTWSATSDDGFQVEVAACSSVSGPASMPVIWNSVQPRSPIGGPAGAAVLSSRTTNSLARNTVDSPAGTVMALVGAVTVPFRVVSVKLPNDPL